jgi:hypothetical protein
MTSQIDSCPGASPLPTRFKPSTHRRCMRMRGAATPGRCAPLLFFDYHFVVEVGGVVTSVYDDLQHPVSHGVEHSISHIPDDNDVAGRLLSIKDLQALDTQRPLIRLHQSCKWQSHPLLGAPAV